MKHIFNQTSGAFATPVRLNQLEEADIWEMFHESPAMTIGIEAFYGMAFSKPPEIKMPNLRLKGSKDIEMLTKGLYETWRRDIYKRLRAFGVVPYKLKAVNDDFVPVVPPVESGHIETFYDYEKCEQKFLWFWKNSTDSEPAKGIEWVVENPPTLDGRFTSAAKSMLMLWKDIKLTFSNAQRVDHITSHLPIFFEQTPPKNQVGQDHLTELSFGDVTEGFVDQDLHQRELNHQIMDRAELNRALLHAHAKDRGAASVANSQPTLWSESDAERYKREGNMWYERAVPLPPHWKPTQPVAPKLARDPLVLLTTFNQLASAVVNFPIEMVISQHANKTGNAEMTLLSANSRVNDVLSRMEEHYRVMILKSYGRRFKAQKKNIKATVRLMRKTPMTLKELLELSHLFEVTVKMTCTSLTSQEDLERLWRNGVISQSTYGRHSVALLGLPEDDVDIQKQTLIFPGTEQELKMQKKYAPTPAQGQGGASDTKKRPSSSSADSKSNPKPKKKAKAITVK